jgi:hypothetical protein
MSERGAQRMVKKTVGNLSFWFALILLLANGVMWADALAPEGPAVAVEPRLAPSIAALREKLIEGGHSGEPFTMEITNQEAAETIAWYLSNHPNIPFSEPQVSIRPDGISAKGTAEIAGLRVGLTGEAGIELREGVPYVALEDLDVAGVAVPGFVQDRIQAEIDAQFGLAQDLPLVIDELHLEEGQATVQGTIR